MGQIRIKIEGIDERPVYMAAANAPPSSLTRIRHPVYTTKWDEAAVFPNVEAAWRHIGRCYPESSFNSRGDLFVDPHKFNVATISFPGS